MKQLADAVFKSHMYRKKSEKRLFFRPARFRSHTHTLTMGLDMSIRALEQSDENTQFSVGNEDLLYDEDNVITSWRSFYVLHYWMQDKALAAGLESCAPSERALDEDGEENPGIRIDWLRLLCVPFRLSRQLLAELEQDLPLIDAMQWRTENLIFSPGVNPASMEKARNLIKIANDHLDQGFDLYYYAC